MLSPSKEDVYLGKEHQLECEQDAIIKKKKYIREQLLKMGFLQEDSDGKILNYSSEEIENFIQKMIKIKEDADSSSEKLVNKNTRSIPKGSHSNLYQHILHGEDIYPLLLKFMDANSLREEKLFNLMNLEKKRKKQFAKKIRYIIRCWKVRYPNTDYVSQKRLYIGKIEEILKQIRNYSRGLSPEYIEGVIRIKNDIQLENELNKILTKEEISKEKNNSLITYIESLYLDFYRDIVVQLIVYDFLNPDFSCQDVKKYFNQIISFLNNVSEILSKSNLVYKSGVRENISSDFFDFLCLTNPLFREKNSFDRFKNMPKIESLTKPLPKDVHFHHFISLKSDQAEYLNCQDFLDLKIIRDILEKEKKNSKIQSGIIPLKIILEKGVFEPFCKSDRSEYIYGTRDFKNNFDKEEKNILEMLKKYDFIQNQNLQSQKVLTTIVNQDKKIIEPYRKTIKSLIKCEETRSSREVLQYLRRRLTEELYKEKEGLHNLELSDQLQEIICNILFKIVLIKDRNKRIQIRTLFFKAFLAELIKIQKDGVITIPPLHL